MQRRACSLEKYLLGKGRRVVVDPALLVCRVHGPVLLVVEEGAARAVDGQQGKVGADPVALRVVVRKQPARAHISYNLPCVWCQQEPGIRLHACKTKHYAAYAGER